MINSTIDSFGTPVNFIYISKIEHFMHDYFENQVKKAKTEKFHADFSYRLDTENCMRSKVFTNHKIRLVFQISQALGYL